jgi:glycosyltransferase involved in cell wall biosynthesis
MMQNLCTGPENPTRDGPPYVSIIVPCRNEGRWIAPCLDSILANDYPHDRLEVLVVDGMSTDETRSIVERYASSGARIQLLDNARQITPVALNIGIAAAQGAVILRMDAHVDYPADYIRTLVDLLQARQADNVGGVCLTRPGADTPMARAIAIGMSHPLGVGNSYFRIGSAEERWVDTVPFGCYRREVFDRIGLFDEDLVRNQDDEFNLRLIRSGGRILLTPRVTCRYFTRDSLGKLWRMYYQYGYFKPLVVRKVKGVMTVRQLVPLAFLLSLAGGLLVAVCGAGLAKWLPPQASLAAFAPFSVLLLAYLALLFACALGAAHRYGLSTALCMFAVLPAIHFSYGLGYLRGIRDFLLRRAPVVEESRQVPISR